MQPEFMNAEGPRAIISVLVSAYNVERYVEEALSSLRAQTIREIQVIVVNDGSTDGTLPILQRIAEADVRIRIISTPTNYGISAARNLGLAACNTPYIACMDADDVAMPDRLEKQLHFLQAHPEIALVGSAMTTINESGEEVGASSVPITANAIMTSLILCPPCSHIWLARRELYERLEGYREMAVAEDYDFLLRAITSGFKIANLPERLTRVRVRPGNTSDRYGLRYRKIHRYVLRLYHERLDKRTDNFSPSDYARAVQVSELSSTLHGHAVRLVRRAFDKPDKIRRFCFFALAAALSPWQARYFWDRLRWRLALRLS
jgi:glycosyltransferase involved in cell wall biosynthesis